MLDMGLFSRLLDGALEFLKSIARKVGVIGTTYLVKLRRGKL